MTRALVALLAVLLPATAARAQVAGGAPSPGARWEIEGYGGFSFAKLPAGGDVTLPPPGPPIPTSSPVFPTREVPSWFFGDGAALLNGVNAEFGLAVRVTPFDAALDALSGSQASGAGFGVRVRRAVAARYSIEISLDVLPGSTSLPDELVTAVEATAQTFEAAMGELLGSGPFANPVVTTSTASADTSGRDVAVTGAVEWRFGSGGVVPYVTYGGGAVFALGDAPAVSLDGRYQAAILGAVPIDETDRVSIQATHDTSFVGVLGGGVRRAMAGGWGVRVDARVMLGKNSTRVVIDATPSVVTGTPAGFIETGTSPAIQFSNNPSTGRTSSLSGTTEDFAVFAGSGMETRVLITIGIYWGR